jgi:hypothetical protein
MFLVFEFPLKFTLLKPLILTRLSYLFLELTNLNLNLKIIIQLRELTLIFSHDSVIFTFKFLKK